MRKNLPSRRTRLFCAAARRCRPERLGEAAGEVARRSSTARVIATLRSDKLMPNRASSLRPGYDHAARRVLCRLGVSEVSTENGILSTGATRGHWHFVPARRAAYAGFATDRRAARPA